MIRSAGDGRDIYFLLNDGGELELSRSSTVLNGTFKRNLFFDAGDAKEAAVTLLDCAGREVETKRIPLSGWTRIDVLPGGRIEIDF